METVSAKEILELLTNGEIIRNVKVLDFINLESLAPDRTFSQPIHFVNCQLHSFDASMIQFQAPVSFQQTIIENENGSFAFSYFFQGLLLENCVFQSRLDFQCGVHNQNDCSFSLHKTIFRDFANFFDCHFDGPVAITDCNFEGGTNLLGNKTAPYRVTFSIPPHIENNRGNLEVNGD
jgi:hypothetical protein